MDTHQGTVTLKWQYLLPILQGATPKGKEIALKKSKFFSFKSGPTGEGIYRTGKQKLSF